MLYLPLAAHAQTLSLRECLSEVIANNPALSAARLGVEASEQATATAKGKYLPRLTLDANYTIRQDPVPFIPAQSPTIGAHFSDRYASWAVMMTLPLYHGGQLMNNVRLSELRTELAQNTLRLTKNDLIANTINTYYKLIQTHRLKEASLRSLEALQSQLDNSRLMYQLGRIAKVDLLKIEAQFANENQRMLSLREAEKTLSATLRFFMGRKTDGPIEDPIRPSDSLEVKAIEIDFSEALSTAKANRPEYLSALAAIKEADLNIKGALSKMLPSINGLSGYIKQYGMNPKYDEGNWIAGINLNIPIFDLPLYSDYRREQIQKRRAYERLKTVEQEITLQIQRAMSSIKEGLIRIEAAEKAVAQAQEAFRIEQEKYKAGAGTMTDLLFAQAAAMTAEANYTQALFDYNVAQTTWRSATGTLEEYLR